MRETRPDRNRAAQTVWVNLKGNVVMESVMESGPVHGLSWRMEMKLAGGMGLNGRGHPGWGPALGIRNPVI